MASKIPRLKYSFKASKDKAGKDGYVYTGTQKDGTAYTSKKYSTEQSAREDVSNQRNQGWLKKQKAERRAPKAAPKVTAPKATTPKVTPKKKKVVGGRSPMMDKMVSKYGPSMKKKGSSQYDIATMAKNVVEGGDVGSWRKRYKMAKPTPKPTPKSKPKKRVIGHEETSTWSGKASDVRKPTVKRKKIYSN
tara:strand:- start:1138 stop:1710 length:573 start_codon:yes stop_codon:yes gene_type:complete